MQKYFRIPLAFFLIAATIGLLLRSQFIWPLGWLQYPYWLHAHSHIMFLGWLLNVLYLFYVRSFCPTQWPRRYRPLFIVIQVLLVGMLVSFPLQGYGVYSIVLSTLHTVAMVWFCGRFFRDTRGLPVTASLWFTKASLVFFLISAIGPFAIGIISARGLGQSNGYYFAVYYYLHFQYNGLFTLGVLGLFFHLLAARNDAFPHATAIRMGRLLAIACVPAYFLSILWAQPHAVFYLAGFAGAVLQLVFIWQFVRFIRKNYSLIIAGTGVLFRRMAGFVLAALVLKFLLQLLSAHPQVAQLAYQNRPYVMAYLHLALVGVITLALLGWYIEQGFLGARYAKITLLLFVSGFCGMEAALVASPSWPAFANSFFPDVQACIWVFSVLLWLGTALFFLSFQRQQTGDTGVI